MFPPVVLHPTLPKLAVRPESGPSSPQESIIPRPGESPTAALFRLYDRNHGRGLTATDETAVIGADHAATQRALDEALRVNAQLVAERDRLKIESAARLQLMTDAYELIDSLQGQLEDAQCAALSAQVH